MTERRDDDSGAAASRKIRAPFNVSLTLLGRARALVFYYGRQLTLTEIAEEGLEMALEKYEKLFRKERGHDVPPLPIGGKIRRGRR